MRERPTRRDSGSRNFKQPFRHRRYLREVVEGENLRGEEMLAERRGELGGRESMKIFSHRGLLGSGHPVTENSMRALAAAVGRGFSIETDFRFGRDRQVVVFHDADLERIFGDPRSTDRVDAAELKTLYEGLSGVEEPDPASLEALLAWPWFRRDEAGCEILVNVKEPHDLSFVLAVCEEVVCAGREAAVWLFDMDQALIPEIHRAYPGVRQLARLSHLPGEGIEDVERLSGEIQGVWFDDYHGDLLASAVTPRVSRLGLPLLFVSPELHPQTHPLGQRGYASSWTEVLGNPAFAGICTDHPLELEQVVGDSLEGS